MEPTTLRARRRGRPADPEEMETIAEAVRTIVADGETVTMEEVARRTGVALATITGRWEDVEDLVIHALSLIAAERVPVPLARDPRTALLAFLHDLATMYDEPHLKRIVARLLIDSTRNPRLAERYRGYWRHRRELATELLVDLLGVRPHADDLEHLLDRLLGSIHYRLLFTGAPVDDGYLGRLVDAIEQEARRLAPRSDEQ